jgi:hypothetical protein
LNFDRSAPTEAFERTGKNQYHTIDLSRHSDKAPETEVSGLDLDSIRVVPGQFYINEFGTLSCYQQMAVPGAKMDAALRQITPVVARTVAMAADGEIQKAKKGAKHITWEEVRNEILEKINEHDQPTPAPKAAPRAEPKPAAKVEPKKKDDPGILLPLEDESIRLLQDAVADKSVKLRRSGSVITVAVPVSKNDGAEAAATFDLITRTIAERIKAGKKIEEGADKFLNAVQVRYAEGAGLEFSADLAKLVKCLNNTDNPKPGEKMKAGYKTTIAAVRARGIEIQENFSIKSVLDEYTK